MSDPKSFCPNCGEPSESEPIHCPLCGYQSHMARDFLWLYAGGGALGLVGIALGITGVVVEGAGPTDWSRALAGWFPLGPWPAAWHWLAMLVAGIVLSLIGLGLTRRSRPAWWWFFALVTWELVWTCREFFTETPISTVISVLLWESLLAALVTRFAMALRRTPRRDVERLQDSARRRPTE
jgi:hypothetical protein